MLGEGLNATARVFSRGVTLACLFGAALASAGVPDQAAPGTAFEIVHSYRTDETRNGVSGGYSQGHSAVIERVIAQRDGGVELEYDEPDAEKRRQWQFPVRVFKPATGAMQLLNAAELEARVDPWLAKANWTRDVCEQWIFTWNAFKIECDPASALEIVDGYGLWPDDLRDGAPFLMDGWLGPAPLRLERGEAGESIYRVTGTFDPAVLKLDQAKADVVIGRIVGKPVTEEQALAALAGTQFSGTVEVRFRVAPSGLVLERITQTETTTRSADGKEETGKRTSSLKRQRLP